MLVLLTMNQVTLTKEFTAGKDLVVIHKSDYDRFLNWSKKYSWADKELEADNDINRGRVSPIYKNKKSLARALNNLKS